MKAKVTVPELKQVTMTVSDIVKSAELIGMVRPKGKKGYVIAVCGKCGPVCNCPLPKEAGGAP